MQLYGEIFAMQLYWNHTSAWVISCKFAGFFQDTFSEEKGGRGWSFLLAANLNLNYFWTTYGMNLKRYDFF